MPSISTRLKTVLISSALLVCLAGLLVYLRPNAQPAPDLSTLPELAIGDWIFRSGTSADSLVIRQLSGSHYSHIGMIVSLEPEVQIIHATTDDDPEHLNQVLLSSLSDFVQPDLATHFAIARPLFLQAAEKQQIAQHLLSQRGAEFIIQPKPLPHRYCTTLLAEAIQLTQADFSLPWQQVDLAFFRGEYLFPNAFAEHQALQWLYQSPEF